MSILSAPAAPRPAPPHPPSACDLSCHRRLRGPYTAGGALLRRLVPELRVLDRGLLVPAATAVAAIAPDLREPVADRPVTLTDLAQGDERTRYYGVQRTRQLAYVVSDLVNGWIRTCHPEGVTLRFWDLCEADPTDVQLFETLRRRASGYGVEIVDGGRRPAPRPGPDPAQQYIDADGTVDAPVLRAAYESLDAIDRAARHTRRAERLIARGDPGSHLGAIPYHLERGADPGAAVSWLVDATNQAFREGYYAASLDLSTRARALVARASDPARHSFLTKRMVGALTYLSRCDEALALIAEHRRDSTEVADQMDSAYMLAMIYTRHLEPARRDLDQALAWVNTAIALADGEADRHRRAFYRAFMRNARALVELRRGNLPGSVTLVNEAIAIADEGLEPEQHHLHRTVLLTNRARAWLELADPDAAIRDFDEVLARDPGYDEPYFDRASAHLSRGDRLAALRDLDQAIDLNPAFIDAYYNRAEIRLDLGDRPGALADLDAVLDIEPEHQDARLNRAALAIEDGDLAHAGADIERGLAAHPGCARLWSARGLLQGEQGDGQGALDCYATALALDPHLVEVYCNRAVLLFTVGRSAAALADLDAAIALQDTAALRVNRGIARSELGDDQGAIEDLDAALGDPDADAAEALFHRGCSHRRRGQYPEAAADWHAHLRLSADSGQVSRYAAQIATYTAEIR